MQYSYLFQFSLLRLLFQDETNLAIFYQNNLLRTMEMTNYKLLSEAINFFASLNGVMISYVDFFINIFELCTAGDPNSPSSVYHTEFSCSLMLMQCVEVSLGI